MLSGMWNSTVIATILPYLHEENHKVLSLVSSAFREVFTRRQYLATMRLIVYSNEQLQDVKASELLLKNVQHLLVLVTQRSDDAMVSQPTQQFVIDAISEVAKVARLTSISVAWCNLNVDSILALHSDSQVGQYRSKLMAIPAENLSELSSISFAPLGVLREAFITLIGRSPRIETLDFRNQPPRWIVSREQSQWFVTSCGLAGLSDLVEIRTHCRNLRRLLGIRVDQSTVAILETLAEAAIQLTDIYIVHDGIAEQLFQNFLRSQPTLVNVHIYDSVSNTPPVRLYEVARSKLANLNKFDVYGLPPTQATHGDQVVANIVSEMKTLSKVRIDSWVRYNFSEPSNLQRVAFRCNEPKKWLLHLPWSVMHSLTSLFLQKVYLTHHNVDALRFACPLLTKLRLKICCFQSDRALVFLSRIALMIKLTVICCQFKNMSPPYLCFRMPQLRRLFIYADFSDSLQRPALALMHNAPNLVRLTVMDFSPNERNIDVADIAWMHGLKQLRWLSTNVHKRHDRTVTFDVSEFPMLERLCVIPRSHGSSTQFVRLEITNAAKQPLYTGDGQVGQLCILFAVKSQTDFDWLRAIRK